jgi:hypothetical protein
MAREEFVKVMWEAWTQGDYESLEGALSPEAQWRAVEDGPWNCANRSQILKTMRENTSSAARRPGSSRRQRTSGTACSLGFDRTASRWTDGRSMMASAT